MNRKEANELIAKQNTDSAETTLLITRKNNRGYYIPTAVEVDPKTHQTWLVVQAVYINNMGVVQSYGREDGRLLAASADTTMWTLASLCENKARTLKAEQARRAEVADTLGVESLDSTDVWEAKRRLEKQVLEILGLADTTDARFSEYGEPHMDIKLTHAQVRALLGLD
jgi:hypothetical protein